MYAYFVFSNLSIYVYEHMCKSISIFIYLYKLFYLSLLIRNLEILAQIKYEPDVTKIIYTGVFKTLIFLFC